MKCILPLIAAIILLSLQASPSRATYTGEAPWCAVVELGGGDVEWDCQYTSVAACAPNVIAGNRGFCAINPYYSPAAYSGAVRVKRRAGRLIYQQ
ncbi:MAG: DUF3551 domain-containing protein [Xanthobacteraceae bacterium]|jgi:hypothetical protein